jgi:hypothetical protein
LEKVSREVDEAVAERRRLLVESDEPAPGALAKAEAAYANAESEKRGLEDACRVLAEQIEDAERRRASEQDQAERHKVANDLERRAIALDAATKAMVAAIANLADTHCGLVAAIRTDGVRAPTLFVGYQQPSPEHLALAIMNSGLADAFPSLWFGVDLRAPDDAPSSGDAVTTAGNIQIGYLWALAAAIRTGTAPISDAIPPQPVQIPPVPVYAETRIVLRKAISYVGVDSRFVPVSTGEMGVPEPVARAAIEKGLGATVGTPEARQILIDLAKSRHGNTGTDGGWIDVGVDLGRFSERRSEAA